MVISRGLTVLAIATAIVVAIPTTGQAQAQDQDHSTAAVFGLGVGAFASTVVWGTAKTLYALGGTAVGGLAWGITGGRMDVARAIIQPAVRGDYVVKTEHLQRRTPITFVGRDPLNEPYPY